MIVFKHVFKRYERKYIITPEQYESLMTPISEYMRGDEYGRSTICNIYFVTPSHMLIRNSIDKPVYKEKLRLRSYGVPDQDSNVFIEIKKKFKGIVYKRRINMSYREAIDFLCHGVPPKKDTQITREISWFLNFYKDIAPAMIITYYRVAFFSKDNPNMRITFDENITWRNWDLDLTLGVYGNRLLLDGYHIMEVKIPEAMPLWLSAKLDELKIFPTSFSKYGNAYKTTIAKTAVLR